MDNKDKANEDCTFKISTVKDSKLSVQFEVEIDGYIATIVYAISRVFLKKDLVFEVFEAGLLLKEDNIDDNILRMVLSGSEYLEVKQQNRDVIFEMRGDPRSIALMIGFLLNDQKNEKPLQSIFARSVMAWSEITKKENADNAIYREIKERMKKEG